MIAGVYKVLVRGLGLFPRRGIISLRTVDNMLSGSFTLFKREIPFSFGSYQDGVIEIDGDLPLAVGKLNYIGKGIIKDKVIKLDLETERGHLTVKGKKQEK
ncbi:MAG: hypothetical protein RSB45_02580 [Bacilli bacterium]